MSDFVVEALRLMKIITTSRAVSVLIKAMMDDKEKQRDYDVTLLDGNKVSDSGLKDLQETKWLKTTNALTTPLFTVTCLLMKSYKIL